MTGLVSLGCLKHTVHFYEKVCEILGPTMEATTSTHTAKVYPGSYILICPHFRYHSQSPISFRTCNCQHCYLLLIHKPWLSSCPVLTEESIVQPRNLETRYQELGSPSWDLLEEWGPVWQSQKDPMPPAVFLGLDLPTLSLINFFLSNSSISSQRILKQTARFNQMLISLKRWLIVSS